MITKRDPHTRKITVSKDYVPPRVVRAGAPVFENTRGGPYRYGFPLRATIDNLRLVEVGVL